MKELIHSERLQEFRWAPPLQTASCSLKCQSHSNSNLITGSRPASALMWHQAWRKVNSLAFYRGWDYIEGSRKEDEFSRDRKINSNPTHGTIRAESLAVALKPTLWPWQSTSPLSSFPLQKIVIITLDSFFHWLLLTLQDLGPRKGFQDMLSHPKFLGGNHWNNTWQNCDYSLPKIGPNEVLKNNIL